MFLKYKKLIFIVLVASTMSNSIFSSDFSNTKTSTLFERLKALFPSPGISYPELGKAGMANIESGLPYIFSVDSDEELAKCFGAPNIFSVDSDEQLDECSNGEVRKPELPKNSN